MHSEKNVSLHFVLSPSLDTHFRLKTAAFLRSDRRERETGGGGGGGEEERRTDKQRKWKGVGGGV